jgi:hypothetical protein
MSARVGNGLHDGVNKLLLGEHLIKLLLCIFIDEQIDIFLFLVWLVRDRLQRGFKKQEQ